MEKSNIDNYLEQLDRDINWFDDSSINNKKNYELLKNVTIICNVLTTVTIALVFIVPQIFQFYVVIIALILSSIVLATYQWEETHNYGPQWASYRNTTEELKRERDLYLNQAGSYNSGNLKENFSFFVEKITYIKEQTDKSYF